MILADTMIWADHFGRPNTELEELLDAGKLRMHRYVRGELSLGNLPRRAVILRDLDDMSQAPVASHAEVIGLIESAQLFGTGVGYVDAHLIASVLLMDSGRLWTREKRMAAVAYRLGIAYNR